MLRLGLAFVYVGFFASFVAAQVEKPNPNAGTKANAIGNRKANIPGISGAATYRD